MSFPLDKFRILYPAFDVIDDSVVSEFAELSRCFADARGCKCSDQAWMALTAHLLQLRDDSSSGNGKPGAIASASIDKVSVSFQTAPAGDSWSYWLNSTPYGQQAAALLKSCSAGGMYVGGLPERAAFLAVYGSRGGRL